MISQSSSNQMLVAGNPLSLVAAYPRLGMPGGVAVATRFGMTAMPHPRLLACHTPLRLCRDATHHLGLHMERQLARGTGPVRR